MDDTDAESSPRAGFKSLYRKLERALTAIERTDDVARTLEVILEALVAEFRGELGFSGGRIYRRDEDGFFLCCGFGRSGELPLGLRVPTDYPPHLRTLEQGLLIMRRGEPGFDEAFERNLGASETIAALVVGERDDFVIAFSIDGEVREERLLYSLTAVRHVINLKLQHRKLTGMIEESRAIQESMLPLRSPSIAGYDVEGRSRPADVVSGDLFDYLPASCCSVGVAIVDASGHGLPAALMARDVVTGLRMSAGEDDTVGPVIERLNGVVHLGALTSKFVSVFYGWIADDGTLTYCNAGHEPPLLQRGASCVALAAGGPVLGPIPGARYEVGRERLGAGDTLLMFTDGITERENAKGEPFGASRLRNLLRDGAAASASELVDTIFTEVDRHAAGTPQTDDMTVVVVRRAESSDSSPSRT